MLTHGQELRAQRLGRWCREGEPCHARVLAELASSDKQPAPATACAPDHEMEM
ncbi:hypothetical protein [Streptomyces natalensis]|uniref:hypothetical protein n=1 Tax=Streptomyces natalensis TaxID=68242 RepID=UPI000A66EA4E|nr:hypothetical protein [Streptomyces natalensis]